jgi:hypothetical protein
MELARAEADETEAADTEEAPEPEPEPEPEPVPEPEPPVGEKALKALEREDTRHVVAVEKALGGAFADLEGCPLCAPFPTGFVPHYALVPDEVAAGMGSAVAEYFGGPDQIEPPYREARTMQRCGDCDGWGQVKSGAQNALHRVEQCPACMGNGYVARSDQPQPQYGAPSPAPVPANGPTGQLPYLDANGYPCAVPPDQYGRRFGDMAYGQPQPQPASAGA